MPSPKPAAGAAIITTLADLTPPSLDRTWLTAPHPRLPLVATCCADKAVRIYSLVNFKLVSTISGGHKRSVRTCAWKPLEKGESVLATGSFDATVGIWRRWDTYGISSVTDDYNKDEDTDLHDLTSQGALDNGDPHHRDLDEDAENDGDDEEWRFAVVLDGHDSEVKSVSWSPAGSLLATCSRDKSVWIWEDLDDGDNNFETVAVLQEHSGDVKCVAWHPNEECLASSSYDDTIRLWREDIDDWTQVACLRGHEGTVWCVDWEAPEGIITGDPPRDQTEERNASRQQHGQQQQCRKDLHALSGPRLASCSDDRTIRIWRRQPQQGSSSSSMEAQQNRLPSIIRPAGIDETWTQESQLPDAHDLSIYAIAWSKRTGLLASTSADGRIVVYEESFSESELTHVTNGLANAATEHCSSAGQRAEPTPMDVDVDSAEIFTSGNNIQDCEGTAARTKWRVLAVIDAAHGIYEINHICWALRADRGKFNGADEEILLSTGDDGVVRAWALERRR